MSLIRPIEHLKRVDVLSGEFVGTVIYNSDPIKTGRVKCTIPNILVGAQAELPWCYPASAGTGGGKSTNTAFAVPEIGAKVNIIFRNNDVLNPVYSGSPQTEATTNDLFNEDYPNSYGQIDSTGFYWKMNKTTKLLTVHHPGGVEISVDATGKVIVHSTANTVRVESATKIEVVAPEIDLTASTKVVVTAPEIDLTASTKVVVTAPQATVTASTKAVVTAPTVEVTATFIKLTGAMTLRGNVNLQGNLIATGSIIGGGKSLVTHTHGNGNNGSPTTPPL